LAEKGSLPAELDLQLEIIGHTGTTIALAGGNKLEELALI